MEIPMPFLSGADETSISLSFKPQAGLLDSGTLYLQYKLPHMDWSKATQVPVEYSKTSNEPKIDVQVVDLLPGTPYIVRLTLQSTETSELRFGPEVVFDTAPIGCTPKKKKSNCVVS
jgi:hypothetical protein